MEKKLLIFLGEEINAQKVKEMLTNAGIECKLRKVKEGLSNALLNSLAEPKENCMAVFVDEKDYPEAKKMLESILLETEKIALWCPECGSEDVKVIFEPCIKKPSWPLWLCLIAYLISAMLCVLHYAFVFLVFIIIVVHGVLRIKKHYGTIRFNVTTYHCNNCGKDFSEEDKF